MRTPALNRPDCLPWIIFAAGLTFWIVIYTLLPPPVPGVDTFLFRDPGCNWAAGRGLTAVSVPHEDYVAPRLFASYTPGAPLLYGFAAKLFGCSARLNGLYDLFWGALLCALLLAAFRQAGQQHAKWQGTWAAVLLVIVLPTGISTADYERPELPALFLLAMALFAWRGRSAPVRSALLIGWNGIVFLIHPFAGLVGLAMLTFLLYRQQGQAAEKLGALLGGLLIFGVVVAASVLYMQHLDPTAVSRFVHHAMGQGTGAGVVLSGKAADGSRLAGFRQAFRHIFSHERPVTAFPLITLVLSFLACLLALLRRRGERGRFTDFALLFALLFLFPAALFLAQPNYFALSRQLLLFLLLLGGFPLARILRSTYVPLVLLAIAVLSLVPEVAVENLRSFETRTTYRAEQEQAARVAARLRALGLSNPRLMTDAEHYYFYKKYFNSLHHVKYVSEEGIAHSQMDAITLCYASSLAFAPSQLAWPAGFHPADWELIDVMDTPQRITVFGHPVMRRNWSWGCDVYRRR